MLCMSLLFSFFIFKIHDTCIWYFGEIRIRILETKLYGSGSNHRLSVYLLMVWRPVHYTVHSLQDINVLSKPSHSLINSRNSSETVPFIQTHFKIIKWNWELKFIFLFPNSLSSISKLILDKHIMMIDTNKLITILIYPILILC